MEISVGVNCSLTMRRSHAHIFYYYPSATRRHGNFAGVHTLLRIILSNNSAYQHNYRRLASAF
jgi:hypothetical protein